MQNQRAYPQIAQITRITETAAHKCRRFPNTGISSSEAVAPEVAAGVIRSPEGKILIAKRFRPCPEGGRWEFPGGTREPGESLEECLRRELKEELDIEVRVDEPFTVIENPYADKPMTLHAFLCTHVAGEPKTIGCADWRWVNPRELQKINLTGADRSIRDALEARSDQSDRSDRSDRSR